jgi:hypothetical protein
MTIIARRLGAAAGIVALGGLLAQPAAAQIRTVDPSSAQAHANAASGNGQPETSGQDDTSLPVQDRDTGTPPPSSDDRAAPPATHASQAADSQTYKESDVLDAAEGVFGRGTEGLAKILEKILKDQGRPTAYIAGREASGAFAVGLRYGSGVLHHKVEGDRPIYWTGPSLGFDIGGNASKEFILVYNLYDSQDAYHRFPAAEGTAYFIGGFTASYLRRGDIVLIPIRLGVGWRLGANVGYMKFTPQSKLLPF